MRNLKKFLALVLAMIMVVSAGAAVSAFDDVAEDNQYAAAIDKLAEYGIVNGTGDGLFSPEDGVNRMQMAIMMARALSPNGDWENGMAIFDDVTEWYGAIAYAYMNNIVTGIGNNLFAPYEGIKYQDALIMAVRALGYTVDVSGTPYWLAAFGQATELGLTKNVAVNKGEQELNRAECAQIIANMISAKPADGGATIEAKNFGIATADNTTTFVITATPKQAYATGYTTSQSKYPEDYIGIQEIVDGLPTGDVVYLPAATFGIAKEDIENYFNYSVDLINYDATKISFTDYKIGKAPVVVYNASVSKNDNRFTYDGVTYYTVEQFTGAPLKNEIVLFNSENFVKDAKILLTNKDGDIINEEGKVVATAVNSSATTAKLYAYNGKVITEAEAITLLGITNSYGTFTKYAAINPSELPANYQLTLFDDDNDSKYERAIATPVYLAVYNPDDNGAKTASFLKKDGLKWSEKLSKGQVITFTYNSQTNEVTVLDVIPEQRGTITRINTINNYGDKNYAIVVTIDGVDYTLGNSVRDVKGITGASLVKENTAFDFDKIASDAVLGYTYNNTTDKNKWTDLSVGSAVKFYALENNTLIAAKCYKIEDSYERVVLKEIVSYDNKFIYVDLYKDGKLNRDVAISKVDNINVATSNIFQLSRLLGDDKMFATGNLFKAVANADGSYQLSTYFVKDSTSDTNNAKAFGLVKAGTEGYYFDRGIADTENGTKPVEKNTEIRANDKTVFYFVNTAKKTVSTYVGAPDKSTIESSAEVYVNKIGYTGDNAGIASFVLVYYTDAAQIKGFGVASVEYSTVYVVNDVNKVNNINYEWRSAADFGLTGSEYDGNYYRKYTADGLAIDMGNGNKVNTLYTNGRDALKANTFYTVSSDGVVLGEANAESTIISNANIYPARYYTIGDIVTPDNKVNVIKLTNAGKIDIKSYDSAVNFDALKTAKTVKYIVDYEDGIFVGVVFPVDTPVDNSKIANAFCDWSDGSRHGAIYDADKNTVTLYREIGGIGTKVETKCTDTAKDSKVSAKIYMDNGTGEYIESKYFNLKVNASYADGVLTINGFTYGELNNALVLKNGNYKVEITFSDNVGTCVATYYTTIG